MSVAVGIVIADIDFGIEEDAPGRAIDPASHATSITSEVKEPFVEPVDVTDAFFHTYRRVEPESW